MVERRVSTRLVDILKKKAVISLSFQCQWSNGAIAEVLNLEQTTVREIVRKTRIKMGLF